LTRPPSKASPAVREAALLKILLIRLRLIGDVVLTTPLIRALRRAYPAARLTYLVEPQAAPVVDANPHLDTVIVAPLLSGLARWRADAALAVRVRRDRYDVVIDLHGGPRSSWLALATGAPVRIGYTVSGRSWMYTRRVARPRGHRDRHSVRNQWDLIEALLPGAPPPDPASDPVEMPALASAALRLDARLRGHGIEATHELIVIHVGAGNPFRRWPESSFADVAAALSATQPNRRIILTTGPAQTLHAETVKRLATSLGAAPERLVIMCDLELAELRSLANRAALFIGGDSGPAHIASAGPVPMVVLYGPTTPAVWGPWRDPALVTEALGIGSLACRPCHQRVCEPGDFRCLRHIGAVEVVAAANRALARDRSRTHASVRT